MWNTAFIFSNKNHGLQEKLFYRKKKFFSVCKNYWITCCTHMTQHTIEVDEITGVVIPIIKINKNENIWKSSFLK